jgi:hypothetical protein
MARIIKRPICEARLECTTALKLPLQTVTDITKVHIGRVVGPGDFATELNGDIDAEQLLGDPSFTLYCFDHQSDEAIFVGCGDQLVVDGSAFYYQGQATQAHSVVKMSLDLFHKLSDQIPWPPEPLLFVHSVGRCGSTLVSKALAAVPGVHSLSEPDDLSQLVNLRGAKEITDEWLRPVMRSSLKWRCKPRSGDPFEFVAIKPRAEVMAMTDLIAELFPKEKHFFLYRDGLTWMSSIFRSFPKEIDFYDPVANRKMEEAWSRVLPLVAELGGGEVPLNRVQIRVIDWITGTEGYLQMRERGLNTAAARFEDLTADPEAILGGLFQFAGIQNADWGAIQDVLSKDSQAGTMYDREQRLSHDHKLTEALIKDVKDLVASRSRLGSHGVILPGTIGIPAK